MSPLLDIGLSDTGNKLDISYSKSLVLLLPWESPFALNTHSQNFNILFGLFPINQMQEFRKNLNHKN